MNKENLSNDTKKMTLEQFANSINADYDEKIKYFLKNTDKYTALIGKYIEKNNNILKNTKCEKHIILERLIKSYISANRNIKNFESLHVLYTSMKEKGDDIIITTGYINTDTLCALSNLYNSYEENVLDIISTMTNTANIKTLKAIAHVFLFYYCSYNKYSSEYLKEYDFIKSLTKKMCSESLFKKAKNIKIKNIEYNINTIKRAINAISQNMIECTTKKIFLDELKSILLMSYGIVSLYKDILKDDNESKNDTEKIEEKSDSEIVNNDKKTKKKNKKLNEKLTNKLIKAIEKADFILKTNIVDNNTRFLALFLNDSDIESSVKTINSVYGHAKALRLVTKEIMNELAIAEKWNMVAHELHKRIENSELENSEKVKSNSIIISKDDKKLNKAINKASLISKCHHIDSVTGKKAFSKNDDGILVCKLCGQKIYTDRHSHLNKDNIKTSAKFINSIFSFIKATKSCPKDIIDELVIAEKWNMVAHKLDECITYSMNEEMGKRAKRKKKSKRDKNERKFNRLF